MRKKLTILLGVLVVIIAAGAAFFIIRDIRKGEELNPPTGTSTSPMPNPSPEISAPDLDRNIHITAPLSEENKKKAREEIDRLVAALKEDPDSYNDWLSLALYWKMIGDYDGAREIWEYLAETRPGEAVSLHNLGNLYANELHDFAKAEQYYLEAIKRRPEFDYLYYAVYEFYRYYVKDLVKAKQILDQAIAALDPESGAKFGELRASF
ncbi:MAG: tetratricopeptide repeat protein [Patescibacteria group bacterium]